MQLLFTLHLCMYVSLAVPTHAFKVRPLPQARSPTALHSTPQPFKANSNPFTRLEAADLPVSRDVSELPLSFSDAVVRASRCTVEVINSGTKTCRIDFDTSVADMTYTSLKNTTPFIKEYVKVLAADLSFGGVGGGAATENSPGNSETGPETSPTMRLFFPDMGAAALVRRDWKMGTDQSEVPACLRTANMQNDPLVPTDRVAIMLCPLYSESDYVKRVVEMCSAASIPCIMVNPELINMDQGFGVRARLMRNTLLAQFITVYKLNTMKEGALVREWPKGYAVWNEDAKQPDGYSLLQCYAREPSRELMYELFDAANPVDPKAKSKEPSAAAAVFGEIKGFFKGMSRL